MKIFFFIFTFFTLAATASEPQLFEIKKIGERSYFVKTASGKSETVGSNSGFIILENKVLVIDAHLNMDAEKKFLKELKKITNKPVQYLTLTHNHKDHVGGENVYDKSVKRVRKTEDLSAEYKIEIINFGHSHSAEDIVVVDHNDQVAFLGDLFVNGYIGYLSEANFKNWILALKRLEGLKLKHYAPGHGSLGDLSSVSAYRQYIEDFVSSARLHFDKKKTLESYQLPAKHQHLGAQFFLNKNISHAYDLWKRGKL